MLKRSVKFVLDNSLLLVFGAAAGLVWANLDVASYQRFVHAVLQSNAPFGDIKASGERVLDLHFLTNDILMAFFFALAGKEIWEATHPGDAFHSLRHAAVPLIATLGGMVGPAGLYLLGALTLGQFPLLARGWAIPCATDIAFSYMVARRIFGKTHPAIPFLLLLAIADDFGGLLILAIFYTRAQVQFGWLALSGVGVVIAIAFKHLRLRSFWWYLLIPGTLAWSGFALVMTALVLGKPIGIWLFAMLGAKGLRLGLPDGLCSRGVLTVGCAAGIGFTVALFMADVAFPEGPVQSAARMGCLASLGAVLPTLAVAKVFGLKKRPKSGRLPAPGVGSPAAQSPGPH